ncbi:hypothetical protein Pfo_020739 [Paulownia fortunei]|nr:hypothetical protein Pfo_020739 [Paulownia fortunei]
MAAYAALVSLMNIMEQIQNHRSHSKFLDEKQIESLRQKVGFLQNFIEGNDHGGRREAEVLERQIASAAYAAEDVIESHVVDQILAGSTGHMERSPSFLLDLQKTIKDMDFIKKKVMRVKVKRQLKDQKSTYSMRLLCGLQKVMESMEEKVMKVKEKRGLKNNRMVGFDDHLIQLMEGLTGQQSNRQIIPIVGMGGIGKTTLAKNVYENLFIVQHFDIRAWVTISHSYSVREILLELLSCQSKQEGRQNLVASTSEMDRETEDQLGEQLYKSLSGMRYLIILDDMWSIEAWDEIKLFFPNDHNRGRIVVTTRLSNLAIHFGSSCIAMNLLDEEKSWNLFCEKAFAQEGCPPEFEEIGKKIAKKCKGLPLTQEYWENFAKDVNSILSSGEDEHCMNILSLSYSHLPAHLKPCFLYIGIFPEDYEIRVSRLIKLWVAEGFLKPNKAQNLEEVAEGYLKDLVDRNLILVRRMGSNGKLKTCNIHDLLRGLCLRVAEKEKFLCVMRLLDIPRDRDRKRRIVFHEIIPQGYHSRVFHTLQSASLARSLICKGGIQLTFKFRLLRVLNVVDSDSLDGIFKQVNLRGGIKRIVAPSGIWEMPQLRHLEFDEICLPDPPSDRVDQQDDFVLRNFQTLLKVVNFKWSEEACKRIPNIKKLHIKYDDFSGECKATSYYCLYNILHLHKLESLNCDFFKLPNRGDLLQNLTFPSSLKKLSLTKCQLHWEDLTMIGSLPHLEVLKLEWGSITGPEWNPVEGEFLRLKFLKIYCSNLIYWTADSSHFPVLESLVLDQLFKLDEIPLGLGEIPTLRVIRLDYCRESAAISAMKILQEQESLGNEGLQVRITFWNNNNHLDYNSCNHQNSCSPQPFTVFDIIFEFRQNLR